MNTDSYFTIGYTHLTGGKPCQDYATSGTLANNAAFAIVSDGCSTGGESDVGARIVALSAAQAIREHWSTTRHIQQDSAEHIKLHQRITMSATQATLGCAHSDMLATCLYAYLSADGGFVHLQGDGVLALQLANGCIYMSRYEWGKELPPEKRAPFYPAYSHDCYAGFIQHYGGNLDAPLLSCEQWIHTPDGSFELFGNHNHTLAQGVRGLTIPLWHDLRTVAVFTDGVTQIDEFDWKDAVLELMAFRNTAGEFAKRRMIRVVRDARAKGKGPLDDLAYAVIHLDGNEGA